MYYQSRSVKNWYVTCVTLIKIICWYIAKKAVMSVAQMIIQIVNIGLLLASVQSIQVSRKLIRGITWNTPKIMCKRILSCDSICNFSNALKSKIFNFGSFSIFILKTCFFSKRLILLCSIFWNAPFSLFSASNRLQMPSYDQFLFHMLFGTFYISLPSCATRTLRA